LVKEAAAAGSATPAPTPAPRPPRLALTETPGRAEDKPDGDEPSPEPPSGGRPSLKRIK
jgi:hypothetical protein